MVVHGKAGVEIAGADEGVAQHRPTDEPRNDAVEEPAGDDIIVEGCREVGASGGVGDHRKEGRETARPRRERAVKFAADRTLAGPAVDEQRVLRAVPPRDIGERILVETAAADDADRIMPGLDPDPAQRTLQQDADRGPGARERDDDAA